MSKSTVVARGWFLVPLWQDGGTLVPPLLKVQVVVLLVDGASFSSQLNGLGDGHQGFCDGRNFDLSSPAIVA
eukprot:9607797-Ditylum_brightwellii.AAC.1